MFDIIVNDFFAKPKTTILRMYFQKHFWCEHCLLRISRWFSTICRRFCKLSFSFVVGIREKTHFAEKHFNVHENCDNFRRKSTVCFNGYFEFRENTKIKLEKNVERNQQRSHSSDLRGGGVVVVLYRIIDVVQHNWTRVFFFFF